MGIRIILDCSTRLWLAGFADSGGRFRVAPVEQEGGRTFFSWAQAYLDQQRYQPPSADLLGRLADMAQGGGSLKGLGWRREGQKMSRDWAPLKDPLTILSEPLAGAPGSRIVRLAAVPLLVFLLRPLLEGLQGLGRFPGNARAMVVVPSGLGRPGRLCLLTALGRVGIHRPRLVPRSLALGAYGLFCLGEQEFIGLDSDEDSLVLRRYSGEIDNDRARLDLLDGKRMAGAGWQPAAALLTRKNGSAPVDGDTAQRRMRRALFGIGPSSSSWPYRDEMEARLSGAAGQGFVRELGGQLKPLIDSLEGDARTLSMSGLCFMVPKLEESLREAVGGGRNFETTLSPARPALGVAAMMAWLAKSPGRQVAYIARQGVFLEAGGSLQRLVTAEAVSRLDRTGRSFRRVMRVKAPAGHAREVFGGHFLQAVGGDALDGQGLALWTRELDLGRREMDSELDIVLTLRSPSGPGRVRGTARVQLGDVEQAIRLRFTDLGMVFNSRTDWATGVVQDQGTFHR